MNAGFKLGKCIKKVPNNVSSITGTFQDNGLQGRVVIEYFDTSGQDSGVFDESVKTTIVGFAKDNRLVGNLRIFTDDQLTEISSVSGEK